jgi:hypothetical protein
MVPVDNPITHSAAAHIKMPQHEIEPFTAETETENGAKQYISTWEK